MTLKEEELQKAKDVALKFESELKEITLKHTSVKDYLNDFLLLSLDVTAISNCFEVPIYVLFM